MTKSVGCHSVVSCLLLLGLLATRADARPPNVVVLLSDNLGFGEIGAYGGGALRGAPTPRLDQLASEGIRFTNFNVELECTPSRSALMTGRMPVRSGTWRAASPGLPGGLAPWEVTIAESLSDEGYATALFGKWHLGDAAGRYPTDQGFDRWWGFPFSTNVASYTEKVGFDPEVTTVPHLLEGVRGEPVRPDEPYTLANRPLIDERIAQRSVDYIREHAGGEAPFFLLVSWSLVHHPYLPHPEFAGRSGADDFADVMVEHDHRVGQVLDAIDEAGIADQGIGHSACVFEPRWRRDEERGTWPSPGTCRWSTYDALRLSREPDPRVPATLRERVWSSPIWIDAS